MSSTKKKHLFLDLDETLVHSSMKKAEEVDNQELSMCLEGKGQNEGENTNSQKMIVNFSIRPYCFEFLTKMAECYTLHLYTAAEPSYA